MPIISAFTFPHPPIMLEQVGKGEEKKIIKTIEACNKCAKLIAKSKPDTIILTSPHSVCYSDYFHISPGTEAFGSLRQFGAESVKINVKYDYELAAEIEKSAGESGIPAGTLGEHDPGLDHGTIIPMIFVNNLKVKLVRIGLSGLSLETHYGLGKSIAKAVAGLKRRVIFIASGDLSHRLKPDGPYGYVEEGPQFDKQVTSALAKGDFSKLMDIDPMLTEKAAECGLRSFVIMAGALDGKKTISELLSYEDIFGVGYAVASFVLE